MLPLKLTFHVTGTPATCPRMTRADVWKKRPIVLRYRDYADKIRAAANGNVPKEEDILSVELFFFLPLPESVSQRKKNLLYGQTHRTRPDIDNLAKGVLDALFEQDYKIPRIEATKFYVQKGKDPETVINLYCSPEQQGECDDSTKRESDSRASLVGPL